MDQQIQLVFLIQLRVVQLRFLPALQQLCQLHLGRLPDPNSFGQIHLIIRREQLMKTNIPQIHAHRVETLPDLLKICDQGLDRFVFFLLDLFFQLDIPLDAWDRSAVLFFDLFGLLEEILFGRRALSQMNILVQFALATQARQRGEGLLLTFGLF